MIHCDIRLCVGCRMCEVTCSTSHFGAVSPALARIRVGKLDETGIDLAIACLGCLEKPCLECPTEALAVGIRGEIQLDAGLCNACEECVEACPIGAVGFHDNHPLFCNLCDGATICVTTCPSGALSYREEYGDVSLQAMLPSVGHSGQKRAVYAGKQGEPIRTAWQSGARVDS